QRFLAGVQRTEDAGELLRLDLAEVDVLDHGEPTLLQDHAERGAQGADPHAPRRAVGEVLRLRRMRASTADEDRSTNRAMAGSARALLLVDLLAGAGDRRPFLGGMRTGATGSELSRDHLVEEVLANLGREHFVTELELAHLFALQVEDVDLCHGKNLVSS